MQPVGGRVEREARDHLVVIAEHRNHGPIGDVFSGANVHPFDRIREAGMNAKRRVFLRADLRHFRRRDLGRRVGPLFGLAQLLPAGQPRQQDCISDQHHGHQDREPARIAVPLREVGLRRLEIPEDMQQKYGFKPLGPADGPVKTAIFSGNSARLYGLEKHAEVIRHDRFAALKADYIANGPGRSNLRYGYVARPA